MMRLAESFLDRIETLVERGRAARAEILDDTALDWVDAEHLDEVHRLMRETLRLLEDAERSFSTEAEETGDSRWTLVSDLAWLSRGEVRSRIESLAWSEKRNLAWKIVSEADSGLERAERALLALEGAVREILGLPPTERTRLRLKESLEVRRLYVALRRSLVQAGEPEGDALATELWALGRQLDAIRTVAAYGVIRVEDRRQIQSLSKRIEAALDTGADSGESEPRRLWQDLDAFSRLLMAIHERDDLRSHDLALVQQSRRRLENGSDPHEILPELRNLLGRDDDLDRLLITPDGHEANARQTLDRALARLEIELHHRTGAAGPREAGPGSPQDW